MYQPHEALSETTLTFLLAYQGRCITWMPVHKLPIPVQKNSVWLGHFSQFGYVQFQQGLTMPPVSDAVQFITPALPVLPLKGQRATVAQEPQHSCHPSHTLHPHLPTKHLPSTPWTSSSQCCFILPHMLIAVPTQILPDSSLESCSYQ